MPPPPSLVYHHTCVFLQLEGLKESLAQVTDNNINGVKNDLDNQHLGLQSYFDKEEII
jgi:hypothetical protein